MKPVMQTRLYDEDGPPGNCFQACIASILGLDLYQVPDELQFYERGVNFRESWPKYWELLLKWLSEYNLTMIEVTHNGHGTDWHESWEIISGPSPRGGGIKHAVVGYGGRVVHDPHPSQAGIGADGRTYIYFVTINPAAAFQLHALR